MSIFAFIGLGFLFSALSCCVVSLIIVGTTELFEDNLGIAIIILLVVAFIAMSLTVFGGIGIETEDQKVFVKIYETKKITIEQSLSNENLSGLERIELVKQAVDLNGELAERKARCERWHCVLYDKTIFNEVEFISLD